MLLYLINLPVNSVVFEDKTSELQAFFSDCEINNIAVSDSLYNRYTFDDSWHKERYGFNLSDTEKKIISAHMYAWELFSQTNEDMCLIIDNSLHLEFKPELLSIKKELQVIEWDVFFPFEEPNHSNIKNTNSEIKNFNKNVREIYDYDSYLIGKKWGSSIYFLNKKAIGILLEEKNLIQNVDDEILTLSIESKINIYCKNVAWFKHEKQKNIIINREIEICRTILSNNVWDQDKLKKIRHLLKILSDIALSLNVDLILQGGTHLGFIRHEGIMQWDDDIDLGIEEKNIKSFFYSLSTHKYIRFGEFLEPRTNIRYYKIWFYDGYVIEGYEYSFPFIDLWVYNKIDSDIIFRNGIICPNSATFPFIDITFEYSKFKIPYNSLECLNSRYNDWRFFVRVYCWSHSTETVGFYRLKTPIIVDDYGKLIKYVYNPEFFL